MNHLCVYTFIYISHMGCISYKQRWRGWASRRLHIHLLMPFETCWSVWTSVEMSLDDDVVIPGISSSVYSVFKEEEQTAGAVVRVVVVLGGERQSWSHWSKKQADELFKQCSIKPKMTSVLDPEKQKFCKWQNWLQLQSISVLFIGHTKLFQSEPQLYSFDFTFYKIGRNSNITMNFTHLRCNLQS